MQEHWFSRNATTLLGIILPWMVVPVVSFMGSPPPAIIALFFLTLVVFFAIKFTLVTSMSNAVSSFLVFAIFFSDAPGSVKLQEEVDFFTAVFFLITAFFVSHLASRHNRYLQEIRLREKLSHVEIQLLEQFTQAIDQEQIIAALQSAVISLSVDYQLVWVRSPEEMLRYLPDEAEELGKKTLSPERLAAIAAQKMLKHVYLLHDRRQLVALLSLASGDVPDITTNAIRLLVHQANIALERSRLTEDLAKEKIAKENELLRSALLSSISHDFRTPLTTMIGATSTVLEMGEQLAREQIKELLSTVVTEAERLNRYTQNLLDMTRLGLGQLRLERHLISPEEIINSLNKRVKPLLQAVSMEIYSDGDLPLLNVHAALIEQALFNAIDNAITFSPNGSRIALVCRREQDWLVILVADEGPGIPLEERDKVFERFYTASRGDRRRSGSGLGLTICKGMISAHGGRVSIHNNADDACQPLPAFLPASGCCVKFELPI